MDPAESLMVTHDVAIAIPNRHVMKRPTVVNHNDGESHEVAMRNLIIACVYLVYI